jgi:hypothetical protein
VLKSTYCISGNDMPRRNLFSAADKTYFVNGDKVRVFFLLRAHFNNNKTLLKVTWRTADEWCTRRGMSLASLKGPYDVYKVGLTLVVEQGYRNCNKNISHLSVKIASFQSATSSGCPRRTGTGREAISRGRTRRRCTKTCGPPATPRNSTTTKNLTRASF